MSEMLEEKRLEKMKQRIIGDVAFCPIALIDCKEKCMWWSNGTCIVHRIHNALADIDSSMEALVRLIGSKR